MLGFGLRVGRFNSVKGLLNPIHPANTFPGTKIQCSYIYIYNINPQKWYYNYTYPNPRYLILTCFAKASNVALTLKRPFFNVFRPTFITFQGIADRGSGFRVQGPSRIRKISFRELLPTAYVCSIFTFFLAPSWLEGGCTIHQTRCNSTTTTVIQISSTQVGVHDPLGFSRFPTQRILTPKTSTLNPKRFI